MILAIVIKITYYFLEYLSYHAPNYLEIIYIDVWDLAPNIFFDNFKFYIIFVYYFTKYILLYYLKYKNKVIIIFTDLRKIVQNFFPSIIKIIYSNK